MVPAQPSSLHSITYLLCTVIVSSFDIITVITASLFLLEHHATRKHSPDFFATTLLVNAAVLMYVILKLCQHVTTRKKRACETFPKFQSDDVIKNSEQYFETNFCALEAYYTSGAKLNPERKLRRGGHFFGLYTSRTQKFYLRRNKKTPFVV